MRPSPCGACCGGICGKAHHCGTMQASSPTNHVQRSQHTARQNSSAVAFTPILYKGKYAFQHAEKKSDLYFPVNRALHFYVMLRQHRTIPALRLKHRSGSCGTASALPKCSIMSGCGTRIVLRGKSPRTLRPLPLLRFAVSATGGAHLCSIQYYLRFWLGICRTSLAVSALRIMRYCPNKACENRGA